jgi:hypothetical protein
MGSISIEVVLSPKIPNIISAFSEVENNRSCSRIKYM